MNIRGVFNAVGALIVFVGVAMVVPLIVAIIEHSRDAESLAYSAGITIVAGAALFFLTRGSHELSTRDGFGVVGFGWISMALFGSLPFLLSGTTAGLTDAFFETMSGFTTTGASILTDIESVPRGVLFWRSFIQWIGGMGIIVLSLAILPMLGVGGMQLYRAEAPGPTPDKLTPRIRQTAAYLWGVYVLISALEAVALKLSGMTVYDAVCHTFTTMATGGFSTRNASVAAFDSARIDWIITFFMLVAGTNFALHYRGWRRPAAYFRDPEWRAYAGIALGAIAIFGGVLVFWDGYRPEWGVRSAAFQVVSILTTTGFATDDYELWHPVLRWGLLLLMFIGGCGGSTAGSIKVVRVLVLAKAALRELAVSANPRVVRAVRLGAGRPLDSGVIQNVLGFFMLFTTIFVVGVTILSVFGLGFETAVSAAATCLTNVGPGLDAVGPTDNFAWLPPPAKWVLVLLMLLGRLEVYTILALFLPQTWKR